MTDLRTHLATHGMCHPNTESDACDVRLVTATDGQPPRLVVTSAINALATPDNASVSA